ncbi:hypothetical protein C2S52_014848 [Perilla frutescens var. hirtella]|nr:hypothetical protein C2S52_014848 [Perilla frutescens var. hirtella]
MKHTSSRRHDFMYEETVEDVRKAELWFDNARACAPSRIKMSTILEEQIANLTKLAEGLAKRIQERDTQILKLNEKMIVDFGGKQADEDNEAEISVKLRANNNEKSTAKEIEISSDGSIQVDQLKDFILETIKDKSGESHKSLWTYNKPYTPIIDNLKMPDGYQPLKFQQFDGKENLIQHVGVTGERIP